MHTTAIVEQHAHRARVDTIVALGREGHLDTRAAAILPEAIADALDLMAVTPPPRIETAQPSPVPHTRNYTGLVAYAEELTALLDRIADYDADPAGTYADEHDTTHLNGTMVAAGREVADRLREEYDTLVEESRTPTQEAHA